jgi:hypothetical protein
MIRTESSFKIGLVPKLHAICCIVLSSCAICQRMVVSCFLCRMLGQKEAHPQIRQEEAVRNLDLVGPPAVVIDSDYHCPSSCNYQSIIDPPNLLFSMVKTEIL